MEVAALAFRFALAGLFVMAAASKLPRRDEFEAVVRRYELLPSALVLPFSRAIPTLELGCGALLAVGLGVAPVSLVLAGVLTVFSGAVAINLLRGREIDCGCFSNAAPRRITWWLVVRNAGLIVMAIATALAAPPALALDGILLADTDVTAGDAVGAAVAGTAGLALAALTSELVRYRNALSALERPRRT